MASVLIVFGSTGGNTELVTDEVAQILNEQKHKVTVQRAELTNESDLSNYNYIILGSSTYGQGLLQEHMAKFIYSVKDLKGKKCAAIGLGDSKYNIEYVVEAAKILEEQIKEKGGEILQPALRINKTPVTYLNTNVKDWAEKLSKLLQ
ncbi:flavodoxin family protein [Patescibacteria group bacterium]